MCQWHPDETKPEPKGFELANGLPFVVRLGSPRAFRQPRGGASPAAADRLGKGAPDL